MQIHILIIPDIIFISYSQCYVYLYRANNITVINRSQINIKHYENAFSCNDLGLLRNKHCNAIFIYLHSQESEIVVDWF